MSDSRGSRIPAPSEVREPTNGPRTAALRESTSSPVYIDTRWQGQHGIGRYASEVVRRLDVPWRPVNVAGDPASPFGLMHRIPRQARTGLVYSPGYNSLLSARRQLVTVHDLIHLQVRGSHALKYRAYYDSVLRPRLRRDRMVITVSETSRDAIAAWLRDDRVTIVNAGNGCSPAFTPRGATAVASDRYVLFVGNLRAHKNVDLLLDAMMRSRGAHLQMVVPTSDVGEATRRVDSRGLTNRVRVVCSLTDDELATVYRGAAATIVPSLYEGFGLPAVESIRCGTPVVHWSDCAAVAETVGDRGIAVKSSRRVAEWSDAIESAVASGRRVSPPADDQFSWDRTASLVSGALRTMADG